MPRGSDLGKFAALEGNARDAKDNTKAILAKAAALQQARKSAGSTHPAIPGITLGRSRLPEPVAAVAARVQAGPSKPGESSGADFSAAPSAVRKRAEQQGATAKAQGPARPPSNSPPKLKKKKKEKTKDKKHEGATDKQKTKKKKDKVKKKSSSSESSHEATQQKRAKKYRGHFAHPSFGGQTLSISIELKKSTATTGEWAIMGQVLDSTVNIMQEESNIVFSDGKVVLDGMIDKKGIVRGEVVMQGEGGGNFVLSADGPNALSPEETKEMVAKERKNEIAQKELKDKEAKEKQKERDKKLKKKEKKKQRTASSDSSDAMRQLRSMNFTGSFSHPSLGNRPVTISVDLRPGSSANLSMGTWSIMGEVLDSKVTVTYEGKHVLLDDGKMVLDGMMNKRGLIRGEVLMQGVDGGSFMLTPGRSDGVAPDRVENVEQGETDPIEMAPPSPQSPSPAMAEAVDDVVSDDSADEAPVLAQRGALAPFVPLSKLNHSARKEPTAMRSRTPVYASRADLQNASSLVQLWSKRDGATTEGSASDRREHGSTFEFSDNVQRLLRQMQEGHAKASLQQPLVTASVVSGQPAGKRRRSENDVATGEVRRPCKLRMCIRFEMGGCRFGDDCPDAHHENELATTVDTAAGV